MAEVVGRRAGGHYMVTLPDGSGTQLDGALLARGLGLSLDPGQEYQLRVGPA